MAESASVPRRAPLWRSLKTAAWLGWQIESNWATPFVFTVYAIAKPLAMAGILVVMYAAITQGNFASPVFTYMYVGNAFYLYVGAVMSGMAWTVIDDRERYRMLTAMYVAPVDFRWYLVGRGVARFATGTLSVAITVVIGVVFLNVSIDPWTIDWPLFAVAMTLGVVMLALLGLLLAAIVLLLTQFAWSLGDAVAGSLFLFSGAAFPLEVLPAWLRPLGYAVPVAYWLELVRRALSAPVAQAFPTFSGYSDLRLLGVLAALILVLAIATLAVFNVCDYLARERGLLDRTTNY